jgi:hypothetical protein
VKRAALQLSSGLIRFHPFNPEENDRYIKKIMIDTIKI